MSRSVTVQVDLTEFDDDEILKAAAWIVERECKKGSSPLSREMDRLAAALIAHPDDDSLPPRSTAAEVTTLDEAWAAIGRERPQ